MAENCQYRELPSIRHVSSGRYEAPDCDRSGELNDAVMLDLGMAETRIVKGASCFGIDRKAWLDKPARQSFVAREIGALTDPGI